MNWNPQMELNYVNNSFPYNSAGSFINFFEGLAYEHVNFIFSDTLHAQESMYPSMHTSLYKFGLSEPESLSYYEYSCAHLLNDHAQSIDEYYRHLENSTTMTSEQTADVHTQWDGNSSTNMTASHVECPRGHHNAHDYQVVWQDNVDPDNMTYEELLELGEAVGTQNRGISQDLISMLPVKKFKCGFFSRKKSRDERWSTNEVTGRSFFHANMPTMSIVAPDGLLSTRLAPFVTLRCLEVCQNSKKLEP
ncbi:E3 ubiquitin-protein ligase BIG BROTHER-like isoform X2 [Actinidia eriantha]|uniref:E3 ubiquitin-protein ligase BIG BROTHER-like isoform X2 n=1 Tax=Actinidia eriantha TaxID=165200 RepID=UPI00258D5359|nr:E3 ubiquitin-protein ligase BIG BROTHER-like isoform X2 [Actinidia eriantha]